LHLDTLASIFLGYSQTMKNVLYYDSSSHQVKTALHVVFDESMADSYAPSPNVHLLHGQSVLSTDVIHASSGLPFLDISSLPFTAFVKIAVQYDPLDNFPFGFEVATCMHLCCAYVSSFTYLFSTLFKAQCDLLGSYIISVSDCPTFSLRDLDALHQSFHSQPSAVSSHILVVLAPECCALFDDHSSPTHLQLHDLQHIAALVNNGGGVNS